MKVPVGPLEYDVRVVHRDVCLDGQRVFGLCDRVRQEIILDGRVSAERRLSVFWHELAHAWQYELDPHQAPTLNEEAVSNLIGIAMAAMAPKLIARLHVLLTRGMEAVDVLLLHGVAEPVPVIAWNGEPLRHGGTEEPVLTGP